MSFLRNLRAETSCISRKTETSCIPTKNVCVPTTNPPLSLKFAFLISLKPQIEVVIRADVSENRLPETKNNFSDYDISQPAPSVSLSVPSCSLVKMDWSWEYKTIFRRYTRGLCSHGTQRTNES